MRVGLTIPAYELSSRRPKTFQEMADIQALLRLPGVDKGEIKGYFERHGLGKKFEELD